MKRIKKQAVLESITLLENANEYVTADLKPEELLNILTQCQEAAILTGNDLETQGESTKELVTMLEEYCELIFQISQSMDDPENRRQLAQTVRNLLIRLHSKTVELLPEDRKEIVFLPYKASMWDSLESVWKAADADPECDAYVIPIPYYDKNPDGSVKKWYYEGTEFPSYVPIVDYKMYNIEENRPDIIFIHNPYDEYNYVTSVHPQYYSSVLKRYTDCLAYVPYFLYPATTELKDIEEHFITTPGVVNADYVFVQNGNVRKVYIETLHKITRLSKEIIEKKIIEIGSPKTDKIVNTTKEDIVIPDTWKPVIMGKKVMFFNTNVSMLLKNRERIIENLRRIFTIIRNHPEFTVIWREHPLSMATIDSMVPEIKQEYLDLKMQFIEEKWGIIDTMPDPYPAMILSDCYFGAGGSLSAIYPISGKPIMIMDYMYPKQIANDTITIEELMNMTSRRMLYTERNINSLEMFIMNLTSLELRKEEQIKRQSVISDNLDGTVGEKIYTFIVSV